MSECVCQTQSIGLRHPSFAGRCRKAMLGVCVCVCVCVEGGECIRACGGGGWGQYMLE